MKRIVFAFIAGVLLFSFATDRKPAWPKEIYNRAQNPSTPAKVDLGRVLFYDPVLSADSSTSCASCHSSFTAFAHVDHNRSHGIHDSIGLRNAPALMNLAWQKNLMWDGAVVHLDVQALAPITNKLEMDEQLPHVLSKLRRSAMYRDLFLKAWGDTLINGERFLKSISTFMLSLESRQAKYDEVLNHEAVFTDQEKNGYALFKKHCDACHREPLFSTYQYASNGLALDPHLRDFGRMRVTQRGSDSLLFRIPSLRNVEFTFPYMHDGRYKTLNEVLKHYTHDLNDAAVLTKPLVKNISLDEHESVDLIAFLLTLSDRQFVFNPDFQYPRKIVSAYAKE